MDSCYGFLLTEKKGKKKEFQQMVADRCRDRWTTGGCVKQQQPPPAHPTEVDEWHEHGPDIHRCTKMWITEKS